MPKEEVPDHSPLRGPPLLGAGRSEATPAANDQPCGAGTRTNEAPGASAPERSGGGDQTRGSDG